MLDGLQGLVRSGADVIEVLPGGSVPISGPLTIKNPVNSDLNAQFSPANPSLSYDLEGFFAGYWFGNGMGINPLDQPSVELGKRLANARLGAGGYAQEEADLAEYLAVPRMEQGF
jgi:Glucose-6-phosphate isomerase